MKGSKDIAKEILNMIFKQGEKSSLVVLVEPIIKKFQHETIEECAKVADRWKEGHSQTGRELAAVIRRLMEKV